MLDAMADTQSGMACDTTDPDLANPDQADWYLAQLRPNQETRARANLERQGYACLLPRCRTTARRRGRLVPATAPLFPGYLFLRVRPGQQWRPINSTYGVVRLVMRREAVPQPVPAAIMGDLLARIDGAGVIAPPDDLRPGEEVRITAGPMAGITARVARLEASGRVGVLLEMMGQAVRAELPRADLSRRAG